MLWSDYTKGIALATMTFKESKHPGKFQEEFGQIGKVTKDALKRGVKAFEDDQGQSERVHGEM